MNRRYDVAVVGAGIIGLSHAYHLARQGRRVLVLERHAQAQGASVRNFGMLWPIGQPAGPRYQLARRSLEIWREVLRANGFWHEQNGSLHLAYHEDEAQVLHEFAAAAHNQGHGYELLSAGRIGKRFTAVRMQGLKSGLFSPVETCIDPRSVIAGLPDWLQHAHGVTFDFNCQVIGYERPVVRTARGDWQAKHLIVCSGDELAALYPELFTDGPLLRCKLQMMRSQPMANHFRLGPMMAAGLTLRHYSAFAECPSLPALVRRLEVTMPEYGRYGIHVMASQNGRGELILGDSHEYGEAIEPFDKAHIEELILKYLDQFLVAPKLRIQGRWHGTYVKHPSEPYFVSRPVDGVTVVTGLGGAGMTLSFGLAEQIATQLE
jgi:FAD dependent oxidoreductase TIGR03364